LINYKDYAHIYDASGQLFFSIKMIAYLQDLLDRHEVTGRHCVDLACGTGTVLKALLQTGWLATGIDGSAEMLEEARQKLAQDGLSCSLIQADMREFHLRAPVDWVTCLYDSINYMLTSKDLLAVFRRVNHALLPGGVFMFDMNTDYALEMLWDDETTFRDNGDLAVIMKSTYDDYLRRVNLVLTAFERRGELYERIVEEHVEQAYPPEEVANLLTDAGFAVEACYDCFTFDPPGEETFRIMWVARKR